jgi:hypothetical protein
MVDTGGEGAPRTREIISNAMLRERWRKVLRSRFAGADFKPPSAALVKSQRGERDGKGVRKMRQVGVRETNASEPLMKCRNGIDEIKTEGIRYLGMNLGATCSPAQMISGIKVA